MPQMETRCFPALIFLVVVRFEQGYFLLNHDYEGEEEYVYHKFWIYPPPSNSHLFHFYDWVSR